RSGADIVTGVRAIDTAGHTPGHISIEISAGSETVVVLGDALTHATVSFAHPEWTPAADHFDRNQAVRTRLRLLDQLAANKSRIIGYHLTFPGIGFVERSGSSYRFIPA